MADALLSMVVIRHGETTLNAAGRYTGQLDPPLTARGRAQAVALAPLVAGAFDRRLHSGAQRAADTLRIACDAAGLHGIELVADPCWRERSFGILEGEPAGGWTQPADLDAAPPGGESYRTIGLRVLAALDALRADALREGRPLRVLLCAHSGVLRMLAAIAADAPDVAAILGPGTPNGAALELTYAAPAMPRFLSSSPS
ncbi:histidine phosphatase family protein [Baekduia sp.]|jgi:probable phosphoglycerate mutase|uniref:histidine phosphatase family protein n=1 Tax=Baekduia sp. TaxID=2600305 RepID=UPI002E0B3887|nr:histidine phosphatase family protein [Baekduia sp.]